MRNDPIGAYRTLDGRRAAYNREGITWIVTDAEAEAINLGRRK
jgi:hypothetical protein